MNLHCVPDFEIQMDEDEYPIPISSGLPRPKKPSLANEEIMELLWDNGQVVMHSQNQRPLRKPPPPSPLKAARNTDGVIHGGPSPAREIRSSQQAGVENYHNQHLFMQEDEMTSWLHYSIHEDPHPPLDHNFCADDILYPPSPNVNGGQNHNSTMQTPLRAPHNATEPRQPSRPVAPRPPIPQTRRPEQVMPKIQNFAHFSKHNARAEPRPSSCSKTTARESTVVDSCDTPVVTAAAAAASRFSEEPTEGDIGRGSTSSAGVAAIWSTSAGGVTGTTTCGGTVTSSPGGSSGSAEPAQMPAVEDRKRKGRELEESECQSEDVDFEFAEAKRQVRGSTSTKRSRAAEVHNLSERKRRDRINEKMRALQELIPRCNKSDKASMLDEAIEYLKSLQLQVQMMSMGCGMVPMMFPGIQQFMQPMGMGIGMGMGMGMDMGMNWPVMPFPNMLTGSALPAGAHLGPMFPTPSFHMPCVPAPNSSRTQAANQSDNMLTSLGTAAPDQSHIPNFTDPYQHYLTPHQMQLQLMEAMNQPNVSKPSTSRGLENPENHQSEEI